MGSVTNKYHPMHGTVVRIKVMHPSAEVRDKEIELPAMVDTGSEYTVVNKDIAKNLLVEAIPGKYLLTVSGKEKFDLYSCRIVITGLGRTFYKVVATSEHIGSVAILGRDVIDSLNCTFKGPEKTLDIVDPSQHVS